MPTAIELEEFRQNPLWRQSIRPALRVQREILEKRLAGGLNLDERELRRLQARYQLLREMEDDPGTFFWPE